MLQPPLFGFLSGRLLLLLGIVLLCPTLAHAQDVSQQELDTMEALNQQGFDAFAGGDFKEAAAYFAQAYKIVPDPNLLKNESIAWYKDGNCPKATMSAELFVSSPKVEDSDKREAKEIIATCGMSEVEALLDRGQWNKAEQMLSYKIRPLGLGPENQRKADDLQQRIDAERTQAKAKEELDRQVVAPPPPDPARAATESPSPPPDDDPNWLGWGLIGGGAALLLTSGILHVRALDAGDEYERESNGGDRARHQELGDSLSRDRLLVPLLYAGSAALLGTGTYLLLRPHTSDIATNGDLIQGGTLQWHVQF